MVRLNPGIPSVLAFLLALGRLSYAAVPAAEDLSGCKLPNGTISLPLEGTPQAAKGALFKVESHALVPYPATPDGQALAPDQAMAILRRSQAADVQFVADRDGSLWAISGCITELGTGYLSEQSGKKLDAPGDLHKTSANRAGLYPSIAEGRIYLLQTTDKKYALLRILEKSKTAAIVQYVYQPDGGLTFDIPHNLPVSFAHPMEPTTESSSAPDAGAPASSMPAATPRTSPQLTAGDLGAPSHPTRIVPPAPKTLEAGPDDYIAPGIIIIGGAGAPGAPTPPGSAPPAAAAGPDPVMEAFTKQRSQMIQSRIGIVSASARTPAEIDAKARAMSDLSLLHADEAADVLVTQIAFFNPRSSAREFSPDAFHPAAAALKHLGKPASAAALNNLRQLDLNAGEGMDSDMYKIGLLGDVIRAVEGDAVAAYLYHQEIDHAADAKRRAVFEYLLAKVPAQ